MRQLRKDIQILWAENLIFRGAASFLCLLLLLALLLPWLPLAYTPNQLDLAHLYQAPFSKPFSVQSHYLGTDGLGRDVLANVLHGIRTAFFISVPVMVLATLLGLALGMVAGFFGDTGLSLRRRGMLVLVFGMASMSYYGVYLPLQLAVADQGAGKIAASMGMGIALPMLLSAVLAILSKRVQFLRESVAIPLDQLVLRLTETMSTIPRFVLILVLASFTPPSVPLLSLIIVLTLWTNTARLARAELMRIKQLPYFEAARSIGLNSWQLMWRQAAPNLLGPVLVAFTFGLGSLLALESTLSFFNIGVPSDLVSWGRTIASIRANTGAWWLVAFPGALLTLTILALYTCSHYLNKIISKKNAA
ncbi:ABC transporter permease [Pontibacter sp. E15-1]|uniref:ABC transporter permease n=1 Tax=Pontibacter sp. E15-1 TaxID=2919918 RepID=UPI001F4F1B2B|nr:ABC transporter permease [Pontibacter sp. E15-1]MCJ8167434.1 ABC transporter permease [Pontibacter sp. E15-1]